nr:hypothetical protein [Tanacetum cinerariifolium]
MDLPKDTPIDRLEVLRYDIGKKSKVRMEIMPTKTELTLEQTQQDQHHGSSDAMHKPSHPLKAILSGADNRPPMLEKDMYDSWKSRIELYMLNRQQGRMILESVEHGPLLWPTVEEDGVTRLKKYSELSAAEAIQADCDVKATNIILQGLPLEVYALVSTHK